MTSSMTKPLTALATLFAFTLPSLAATLRDDFNEASCLNQTYAKSMLTPRGELELKIGAGGAQYLQTTKSLGYGRYEARIKTDLGGGAVVAFYIMGIEGHLRNNPAYFNFHDEVDFELVGTLWREGQYLGNNATWINAYSQHRSLILARHPRDDAGGSLIAMGELISKNRALLNRQTLPDLDRTSNFIGHNFNDGKFYTYILDYSPEAISFLVRNDEGVILRNYVLANRQNGWPREPMYLAISLWTSTDPNLARNFLGYYDHQFGRPMSATIDYISFSPANQEQESDLRAMPWNICPVGITNRCLSVNRDGITCSQVGMAEGQIARPWNGVAGQFQCIDGCIKYIGP